MNFTFESELNREGYAEPIRVIVTYSAERPSPENGFTGELTLQCVTPLGTASAAELVTTRGENAQLSEEAHEDFGRKYA